MQKKLKGVRILKVPVSVALLHAAAIRYKQWLLAVHKEIINYIFLTSTAINFTAYGIMALCRYFVMCCAVHYVKSERCSNCLSTFFHGCHSWLWV